MMLRPPMTAVPVKSTEKPLCDSRMSTEPFRSTRRKLESSGVTK